MDQSATLPAPSEVLFPELFERPLRIRFDGARHSSDGGLPLLAAIDKRINLTASLAACLIDPRNPLLITYPLLGLLRQRLFALCCGHEDLNDADALRFDPLHGLASGRPADKPIASDSTLARMELRPRPAELRRMGRALMDVVLSHAAKARKKQSVPRITIDLDATCDPAHGQQQLVFFNGAYGCHCYLPLVFVVTFHTPGGQEEREQYLVAVLLRPGAGEGSGSYGVRAVLKGLVKRLRTHFPGSAIRVRCDGGFGGGPFFQLMEDMGLEYVAGFSEKPALAAVAEPHMAFARTNSAVSGESARCYAETPYKAQKWSAARRVVIKAEVTREGTRAPRDNPRYVVTNLPREAYSAQEIYENIYCMRGDSENRIKELKDACALDRTSSGKFLANQFRVLLSAAAYVLFQVLRESLANTELEKAQAWRLREVLIKLGATLKATTRRLQLTLPRATPLQNLWLSVAKEWGAASP
jgi:Transposase DDE domain group 1